MKNNNSFDLSISIPKINLSERNLELYTKFMFFIAFAGSIPLIIQTYKIYKEKRTEGVSRFSYIFYLIITIPWIIYAMIKSDTSIFISSIMKIILLSILIYLICIYSSRV